MPEVESSTARSRVRLTKEGYAFLSNYARTVNSYPHKSEKQSILASVRAIPGNDAFTLEKLSSWFARNRKPSPDGPVLVDDETILFPKLTPVHLQQLRVLYKKRCGPSEGIMTFWADRIHADRAEVAAWIQYQQEKEKARDVGASSESPDIPSQQLAEDSCDTASVSPTIYEFPRPHLPTPAKSLSPSRSPQTRVPSLPPIAVKVEELRQCLSPVSSLTAPLLKPRPAESYIHSNELSSALEGLPPFSRLQQPSVRVELSPVAISASNPLSHVSKGPSRRDSTMTLTATIRDSFRSDTVLNEQPPRTVDEFAQKFEEVENMIDAFLKKHDSGQLVRLGWTSNPSKTEL